MSQVQTVKSASDIVQIIGERVTLQRSGNAWRGLCPFHSERSPSFFVNDQFQRYKCFGCGESGDVFTFLEKYDGMTFGEAMQYLADRAGIKLTSYQPTAADEQRERLLAILHLAKEYYHYVLTQHPAGEPARQYLQERGVTQESIKIFQLGYAQGSWEGLVQYLHKKKKYPIEDLLAAGLVIMGKGGRPYDRFRDRIMFPLANHRGQVVGFSGRMLEAKPKEAKYINTPETELYHKGKMLFGFAELYQEIRKKKEIVLVEGELDVISSTQAHVNHTVAIKGSALTLDHVQLVQRVAERLLLALDADEAGVKATQRAISMTENSPVEVRVVPLPAGQDPDDLARTQPAEWRRLVKSSISAYDFLIKTALAAHDGNSPEGRRKVVLEVGPYLARIKMAVEQDVYIKKLAALLQVKEELLRRDVQRMESQLATKAGARPAPVSSVPAAEPAAPKVEPQDQTGRLEQYVLFVALKLGPAGVAPLLPSWQKLHWRQAEHQQIAAEMAKQVQQKPTATEFTWQAVPELERTMVFELMYQPQLQEQLGEIEAESELAPAIAQLERLHTQHRINDITKELASLDAKPDKNDAEEARLTQLLSEVVQLQARLKPGKVKSA